MAPGTPTGLAGGSLGPERSESSLSFQVSERRRKRSSSSYSTASSLVHTGMNN